MKPTPEEAVAKPLVMVSGDEAALRREALGRLLQAAGVQPDDFDLQYFDGEADPGDWAAAAGTAPFLAERRTVVVRQLLRADLDKARAALQGLPATSLLILVADEESDDEDKQRRLKTARTAWEKLVKSAGGEVIECKTDPRGLRDLLDQAAEKHGKKLTPRAMEALLEMCSGSASAALEELPKLVLYTGEEKAIQEADVRALVVPSRDWNVFRMVDAVVEGDVATALRQLRILVGASSKAEDQAFRTILPQLSRTLRLIWQARVCLDAKTAPEAASETIRACFLSRPHLPSESDFVRNKAARAARHVSLPQITEMLQIVSDCDARLKGLLPSFSAIETLEQTMLKMVQVARPKAALR